MAEFPALPLWTDAYLGDTMHLDATEHGAYLLLLMSAWRMPETVLPDNDKLLARWARCTPKMWKRVRPALEPFFQIENGKWTQLRLLEEKLVVSRKRDSAAANGKASALKRKDRHAAKRPTERSTKVDASDERSDQLTISSITLANAKGGEPPSDSNVLDQSKELFSSGVRLLTATGTAEKQARSLIGKWRKGHGDEEVLAAVQAARQGGISEPVEWITKRLKSLGEKRATEQAVRADMLKRMSALPPVPRSGSQGSMAERAAA